MPEKITAEPFKGGYGVFRTFREDGQEKKEIVTRTGVGGEEDGGKAQAEEYAAGLRKKQT